MLITQHNARPARAGMPTAPDGDMADTSLRLCGIGQQTDPGITREAAALGVAAEIVAGDPPSGVREQHVGRAVPARPGIKPGGHQLPR